MPPPEARIWLGHGHAGVEHRRQPVAQAEGDAFEHGPRQVPSLVGGGQADERAARERIDVRAALARSGRAGSAGRRCPRGRRPPRRPGRRTASPAPDASRYQRRLPAAESMTDIRCQRPGTAWQKAWTRPCGSWIGRIGRREDDARRAQRERHRADRDGTDADRVGRLVAAAGDDRRPRAQARRGGRRGADAAGHLRPLERRLASRPGRCPARPATSGDQSRAARSKSSVPAPSALSSA